MEHFTPGSATERSFRDALGCFATGVAVVTAAAEDGPTGITANSFASVSLDPPLVLWSPAKTSRRFRLFAQARAFAIHVLAEDQLAIMRHFADAGDDFSAVRWHRGPLDVPLIDTCLARFECRREAAHDAGDHVIVLGRVVGAAVGAGAPLIFAQGNYGRFTARD